MRRHGTPSHRERQAPPLIASLGIAARDNPRRRHPSPEITERALLAFAHDAWEVWSLEVLPWFSVRTRLSHGRISNPAGSYALIWGPAKSITRPASTSPPSRPVSINTTSTVSTVVCITEHAWSHHHMAFTNSLSFAWIAGSVCSSLARCDSTCLIRFMDSLTCTTQGASPAADGQGLAQCARERSPGTPGSQRASPSWRHLTPPTCILPLYPNPNTVL